MRQLFVDVDNFFSHARISRHFRSTKNPQEVKNKSVDTRFFFRFANILSLLVPIFSSSFFVVFKERERTRGCLSKRVKNISRRSNTASRAFIHLKLPPRVRTAVFGRLFFSGRQRLIICCCRGLRKNCRR